MKIETELVQLGLEEQTTRSLNGTGPEVVSSRPYEILEYPVVISSDRKPGNFIEEGRSFAFLELLGTGDNGHVRKGRYFVYDPNIITDIIVVVRGFTEEQLEHQKSLYADSHQLADTGDEAILVFYKQSEK